VRRRTVDRIACVAVDNQPAPASLLRETWPIFTAELATALDAYGDDRLTVQVDRLRIVAVCACGDDFCQSFYTGPKPAGAYGPGHRNVCLEPSWPGYLILDVLHDDIVHIEVLYRTPLN
jgi:hypothetical protein